ncbi:hypothetical protein [Halorarum halobium]|uniref:hypothetical protein n=1 Tax=Halorarum halobium TaxID=3075121 RepID=UPI0028AC94B3|nr:hypothetical protein [Halobaculum sp. XH14]
MQPSRRRTLGALACTALAGLAGCTSGFGSDGTSTDDSSAGKPSTDGTPSDEQPTGGTPAVDLEASLHGPDGTRHLFDERDVETVGPVERTGSSPGVPVTLTDGGTSSVGETVRTAGVADDPDACEIAIAVDGEEENRFGITGGLAEAIAEGEWEGEFLLLFEDRERATKVRQALLGTGTE